MSNKQRLEQIDRFLCFYGRVSRDMLVEVLAISTATASRSLREYCSAYPKSIRLVSGQSGGYRTSDNFTPQADYDAEAALKLICDGAIANTINIPTFGPKQTSIKRVKLRAEVVAPITRAIVSSSAVNIAYTSGSSGSTERIVHPNHVFSGGSSWYFRAFDQKSAEYRTFRFSRVTTAKACKHTAPVMEDNDWNKVVTLTIMPHDKHPHPEAHALDIGVIEGRAQNVLSNAVIAGFLLNDLRVDCSASGSLDPLEHPFRLINPHELTDIGSMKIAPGYYLSSNKTNNELD